MAKRKNSTTQRTTNTSGLKKNQIQRKLETRFSFINSLRESNKYSKEKVLDYDIQEIKDILADLQKTYNQYLVVYEMLQRMQENFSEQSNILKEISSVLQNNISGSTAVTNLASLLVNDQNNLSLALNMYEKYYNNFFESFNKSIDILEKVGSSLRGETNLFHIGMLDENGFLKEFSLDDMSMGKFRRDQSIFKLSLSDNNQIRMTSKANLERTNIIDSLQQALGGQGIKTFSRYGVGEIQSSLSTQQIWSDYQRGNLFSRRKNDTFGSALKMGRRYEAFEEGMASIEGPIAHLKKLQDKGYVLDTLPWVAGQDNSKFDQITETQYAIQNKFFNFNDNGNTGNSRIGISSLTTIFDTLDLLTKPDMVMDRYIHYNEQTLYNMNEEQLFTELYNWQGQGQFDNPFLSTYDQAIDQFGQELAQDFSGFGLEAFWE